MSGVIQRLRAQRQSWVDIEPGKRIQIMRPPENDFPAFLSGEGETRRVSANLEQVCKYVVGWDGISEADLLGAAVGSSDPLAFDSALWAEVVADKADWFNAVASALVTAMVQHFEKKAEVSKN